MQAEDIRIGVALTLFARGTRESSLYPSFKAGRERERERERERDLVYLLFSAARLGGIVYNFLLTERKNTHSVESTELYQCVKPR